LVTDNEKAYITSNNVNISLDFHIKWAKLFSYRQLWGLLSAKILVDSAWYFIIFWLPKYLADARGLNIKEIGSYAWIPYACAGAGSLIGGWLSNYLIKRNVSIDISRKVTLGIAAAMMPVSLFIANAPIAMAIVLFSIAMFGHQFFSTIIQTTCTDLFPNKVVGAVSGLAGSFGSFGAMFFSLLAGQVISSVGYTPVFIMVGLMHPTAFIILLILVRKFEQVKQFS
jgi:ACS family hexuronate transporter-like MFS transporter